PTYVQDTNEAVRKLELFRFTPDKPRFLFSMDVKSLYIYISHTDGLLALQHFLNKRAVKDPPTFVLMRLAELVLNGNCFSFNGKHYIQKRGVAMGSCFGPSYACLFMSYQEELFFSSFQGTKPECYVRYIDDGFGAVSSSRDELLQFIDFVNNFNPAIQYPHEISEITLPFLDISTKVDGDRISTSIYTKPTDSHCYLQYESSHHTRMNDSIPYSQLLRTSEETSSTFPLMPTTAWRRDTNLKRLLVHTGERGDPEKYGSVLCNLPR
ncbi:uncharacterized protein LOC144342970, partial [Saccoglossus kowalevskii]